jgi:hypothetical protein
VGQDDSQAGIPVYDAVEYELDGGPRGLEREVRHRGSDSGRWRDERLAGPGLGRRSCVLRAAMRKAAGGFSSLRGSRRGGAGDGAAGGW